MQGITARIKYRKNGLIRFIGHLDTARALLRAVRRARIDGVYSQGFTPRLRVSFGPPLPLGWTSECEYFDIKLARMCEPETIKERLQSHLPEGLFIEEVQVLEGSPPSLETTFRAVEYEVELPEHLAISPVAQASVPMHAPACVGLCELERLSSKKGAPVRDSRENDDLRKGALSRLVQACWREKDAGRRVLCLVLRQEPTGGGRLKEIIGGFLGMQGEELEKLKIHKKRVYAKGEDVPRSHPGPNPITLNDKIEQ